MPLINFSGLASGIDSEALIEATQEARRAARVVPKEEEVAAIEGESSALEELTTMLNDLKSQLLSFTDLSGGGILKTVTSSNEAAVSAVASNSASNGTYTITSITQLAANHTFTFSEAISDPAAAIPAGDGALQISVNGETISVILNGTATTYNEIVNEINEASDSVTAQLINVAAPNDPASYRIVLTSTNVGEDQGLMSVTCDVPGTLNTAVATEVPAQNAIFTLQGVGPIERGSNTINDVIPGVTISLENDNISSPINLQVKVDSAGTESAVSSIIEKYNEIVKFVNENNLITREDQGREVTNIFGPLANTRVDDGVLGGLRSAIVGSSYTNSGETNEVRIFAGMGIATERDGTLTFRTEDSPLGKGFQSALANEPDSVSQILQNFANATAKTGALIEQYTKFGGLIDNVETQNQRRLTDLNDQIARAEEAIEREAQQIRARFARLERTVSELQSQQGALTSALAGLGR